MALTGLRNFHRWSTRRLNHCITPFCLWKQGTEERYWGQQICQMKREISVRQVKVGHLQSWSRIFRSDLTEMVHSILCTNRNYRNLGWMERAPPFQLKSIANARFKGFTRQVKENSIRIDWRLRVCLDKVSHETFSRLSYKNIIENPEEKPEWLTEGLTYLLPKTKETTNPKNYRPITCLPTIFKTSPHFHYCRKNIYILNWTPAFTNRTKRV